MFCAIYKFVLILFPSTYTYLPEIGLAMGSKLIETFLLSGLVITIHH